MTIKMAIIVNVNRVYIAKIFINIKRTLYEKEGKYLKKTIVYHNDFNRYVDLISGEEYKLGLEYTYPGDMYIYLKDGLIPVANVLDVSFKKKNMPKKKILKNINKVILLNEKEDDK